MKKIILIKQEDINKMDVNHLNSFLNKALKAMGPSEVTNEYKIFLMANEPRLYDKNLVILT